LEERSTKRQFRHGTHGLGFSLNSIEGESIPTFTSYIEKVLGRGFGLSDGVRNRISNPLTPHLPGDGHHKRKLAFFLLHGERVAVQHGGKAALRAER